MSLILRKTSLVAVAFIFSIVGISATNYLSSPIGNSPIQNAEAQLASIKPRIAFLQPTFTFAAYQNNSFYTFYKKYTPITPPDKNVTSDLKLLSNKKVPHGPIILYNDKPGTIPGIPYILYSTNLLGGIEKILPRADITNLTDEDVDGGKLFSANGSNLFDVLFLIHEEYVTQKMYDSFKRFVEGGGKIVFTDSNVLYVEVSYNNQTDTISLVRGHGWKFDNNVARRDINERWANESTEWVGSNTLFKWTKLYFNNNPFDYVKAEEANVTNSQARILHDYMVFDPNDLNFKAKVATYEMDFGKGKVIMTSLFANTMYDNPKFLRFFEYIIIPHALGSAHKLSLNGVSHDILSLLDNGIISDITQKDSDAITVNLNGSVNNLDHLVIVIPTGVWGISSLSPQDYLKFNVTIDGVPSRYDVSNIQTESGLYIPLGSHAKKVEISSKLIHIPFSIIPPKDIKVEAKNRTMVFDLGKPVIRGEPNGPYSIVNDKPSEFPIGKTVVKWTISSPDGLSTYAFQNVTIYDQKKPSITITDPPDRSVVVSKDGKIMVMGTASDFQSGIKKVDVRISDSGQKTFSIYELAKPGPNGGWASWVASIQPKAFDTPVLVQARVTDFAGNVDWDKALVVVKK